MITVENPFQQALIDEVESLIFVVDELHDTVTNMLNLLIALASHRTNELITILTIFSAFFIPLTFIAGIYGMNFR